jgi:hypothetical protein
MVEIRWGIFSLTVLQFLNEFTKTAIGTYPKPAESTSHSHTICMREPWMLLIGIEGRQRR